MIIDPVADMIIRVKNALQGRSKEVLIPKSKFKVALLKVLTENGFIDKCSIKNKNSRTYILVNLKYTNNRPAITQFKRISKPGLRVYSNFNKVPYSLDGFGTIIISTSKGIMTDKQARKQHLGGELICEIY